MIKKTLAAGMLSLIIGFSSLSAYAQVEEQYQAAKQTMIMTHKMQKAALETKHRKEKAALEALHAKQEAEFKAVWEKAGIANPSLSTASGEMSDFRSELEKKIKELQGDSSIDSADENTLKGKLEQWKKEYDKKKSKKEIEQKVEEGRKKIRKKVEEIKEKRGK